MSEQRAASGEGQGEPLANHAESEPSLVSHSSSLFPMKDAEARQKALDPTKSFIIQAPAGSGKTELLIQRFLVLLAQVENPEEVVAITFTRKASEEMRSRILDALKGAAREEPTAPHARTTWRLARRVRERDRIKGWSLEEYPSRLRIHTIDALCAALTRQMPVLSNFGSQPEPMEDARELYREGASRTLEELEHGPPCSDHVARLLAHLDNRMETLERLIAEMLPKRDQWIRHVIDAPPKEVLSDALEHLIEDTLEEIGEAFAQTKAIPMPADMARSIMASLDGASSEQRAASGERQGEPLAAGCSPLANHADPDILGPPSGGLQDLAFWKAAADFLLTKKGTWRRRLDKRYGFPAQAKEAVRFLALIESLSKVPGLEEKLSRVRELPQGYDPSQWTLLESLVYVLKRAVAQLCIVFQERHRVDFTEIAQRALQALGHAEAPTDLLLALDYRIRHILVDEFQDTSISQFELLERLTAGWEPGDGRTLFLVGDPMQSIYRFRDAEVGLFLKAARQGLGHLPLTRLTLTVNFRSHQGLVAWFNRAFSQAFPKAEDIALGAVPYVPCEAHREAIQGQAVTFHCFSQKDPEGEAEKVVALVKEGLKEGKVAILVRHRHHLAHILPALKREAIPYQGVDIEPLVQRPVIQDLIALTQALTHPAHRLAWLAILRAPWCGLTLKDLCALAEEDKDAPLWELMEDDIRLAALSEEGRRRLLQVREVLERAMAQRHRLPLRRLVEGTWMALGGPACVESETDLKDARVFFERLEELEEGGDLGDPQALPEKLGDLYASPDVEADDRLQIMTIHKAKGLEFDTVILPGLGMQGKNEDNRLLLWLERPRTLHGDSDLLLAPLNPEDKVYRYLKLMDREKDHYESGRLLYVAATRAKKRLHLLGHKGKYAPGRSTLLYHLWPLLKDSAQEPPYQPSPIPHSPPPLRRLSMDWRLPDPPPCLDTPSPLPVSETPEFEWAGETIRHVGTVVHRMLQRIGQEGLEGWGKTRIDAFIPYYRNALLRLGVPEEALDKAVEQVRQALLKTLQDRRGRWILGQQGKCEYAITGLYRGQVVSAVIDRTFLDQGIRWIIDYKASIHQGGDVESFLDQEQERYRNQLERYGTLMAAIDPHPIRLGLYFPLLQGWRAFPFKA